MSERTETQLHGILWEKDILINVYGATQDELGAISYTSKFDLPAELNRLDGVNLSVKTTCCIKTVCMADCLRIFDTVCGNIPFHLVVIQYKQNDERKCKIVENIIEIDLSSSREILFGTATREQLVELIDSVRIVPQKRKPTKEEHAKMYALRDAIQPIMGAIHLDIKCNSTQSRVQCSLNRFQDFMQKYPERIVSKSNTNEFRGGRITAEIPSSRRIFKKASKQSSVESSSTSASVLSSSTDTECPIVVASENFPQDACTTSFVTMHENLTAEPSDIVSESSATCSSNIPPQAS